MKGKRLFNFLVLAVCVLAGVAATQWYSQQLATATFDDTDVLVVERAAPHALRSATLANLRTYMQIGMPTTNNLASTNYVNTATNSLASTNYVKTVTNSVASTNYVNTVTNGLASTNYVNTTALLSTNGSVDRTNLADNTKVIFNPDQFGTNGSGPFNVFIRSNVFLTNPVVASGFISGNGSGLTNVHMTNLVDDAGTPLFSQSGDALTLSWFGGQETIVFEAGGDSITIGPTVIIDSNLTVNSIAKIYGAQTNFSGAYSLASTTNSPSTLEFATAGWVRSLLGSGAHYYNSTNLAAGWLPTKGDVQPFLYLPDIPAPAVRTYASAYLTNSGYLGGIAITNLTQFEGPFVVGTYVGYSGGAATPTLTIKPEIYYSYDNGTNLLGDWDAQAQSIAHGQTNLYTWVVSVPSTVSTGGTFTVYRLFKIVAASFVGSPTLSIHVGTNTPSHISFTQPVVAGGTYTGTFSGDGSGLTNLNALSPLQVTNAITDATNGLTGGSLSPVAFGLANLASAMGSNTFWENPSSGIILKTDFNGAIIPLATGNASGGTSPGTAIGQGYVGIAPTNIASYSAFRYGSALIVWTSNFLFDTKVYLSVGNESAYYDFGLLSTFTTTEDQVHSVRWIGNTNFSANWIAGCTRDSTSTYWTSGIPVEISLTNRFTIYAPTTNAVYFYTNQVLACAITDNIPGGQGLNVAARVNSLSTNGASATQYMNFDWWYSIFQ